MNFNVYVDGEYIGDVQEDSEALARLAAISKFDIPIFEAGEEVTLELVED